MNLAQILEKLVGSLPALPDLSVRAYIGYDGYVDKIQKVVEARQGTENLYFEQISDLAGLVKSLAGRSGQIELVTLETKIGGNAPIMSQALAALGVGNWCAGNMDHPVFEQIHPACDRILLGPPAESNALEFGDGKVIFSEVSVFKKLTWPFISGEIGLENLRSYFLQSRLIAFVDWANLPHANELWKCYLQEIVKPAYSERHIEACFFFDLSDPTKRSADDIREALKIVSSYQDYGQVVLGMNENEARRIWLALNGFSPSDAGRVELTPELAVIAAFIRDEASINIVLIHPTDRALVATINGITELPGRLVTVPKILTGGGDNLNAGFCWGLLHGLDIPSCMVLGMANSGAYIGNGSSPDKEALTFYLKTWLNEISGTQMSSKERDPKSLSFSGSVM